MESKSSHFKFYVQLDLHLKSALLHINRGECIYIMPRICSGNSLVKLGSLGKVSGFPTKFKKKIFGKNIEGNINKLSFESKNLSIHLNARIYGHSSLLENVGLVEFEWEKFPIFSLLSGNSFHI